MHFRLRTLLIVLAVGPMVLAGVWFGWQRYLENRRQRQFEEILKECEQLRDSDKLPNLPQRGSII